MTIANRRSFLISRGWIQAVVIVFVFGFFILGLLAYETYRKEPPIPAKVVGSDGRVVFTRDDILDGQSIFLRNGLMEYGSIFGHGAYLGPDFTADYLHRAALSVLAAYGGESDRSRLQTIADFTTNRYNSDTQVLAFTAADVRAFEELEIYYGQFFGNPTTKFGLRPRAIADPQHIHQLVAFFAWSAWAASARRPGLAYSYTNNWPPEPLVDNHATADAVVWSVLSLVALLGGIGLLLAAFGRWNFLGWHGREQMTVSFRPPDRVALTPAQRACAWFFFVMALLFVLQTLLGGASQHYRADISNFFGLDLARLLPFNVARTWHLQLAIFWVATSYLAAGIFLVPMITGREPPGQSGLAYALLGALVLVVFGSLVGEFAGIEGLIRSGWAWFGNHCRPGGVRPYREFRARAATVSPKPFQFRQRARSTS
jgi:nitric oxide reductase subunit B